MTSHPASDAVDALNDVDALAQLAFLVHGALDERSAEAGISVTLARLLGILRDREPTINELGTHLELDKSSVSGLIDRAERRGLVVRVPSEVDRRSVRVRVTNAGKAVTRTVQHSFNADIRGALALLSPGDRAALIRGASALVRAATGAGFDA
jgi:DNA-binding MarR family transcriptional regulator